MSTEENKAAIRRLMEESWHKGNPTILDELYAEDIVGHSPLYQITGRANMRTLAQAAAAIFGDAQLTIEDLVAEGDKVAMRFTNTVTHVGTIFGVAPTGKRITETGLAIFRIVAGQVVEYWDQPDVLGMMQQLGAMPVHPNRRRSNEEHC